MSEYRIDELARQAGTTVRNVRVYQDRGLLAGPRRDGRVGIYSDAHLARLRLIGQLLKREIQASPIASAAAVLMRSALEQVRKRVDYEEVGGAPLLGVRGVGVIAHGRSSARAIEQSAESS